MRRANARLSNEIHFYTERIMVLHEAMNDKKNSGGEFFLMEGPALMPLDYIEAASAENNIPAPFFILSDDDEDEDMEEEDGFDDMEEDFDDDDDYEDDGFDDDDDEDDDFDDDEEDDFDYDEDGDYDDFDE
jgi:hypothetical protein